MINFKTISETFSGFLEESATVEIGTKNFLILEIIKINKKIWDLEDIARMKELGFEKIAETKSEIDKNNQLRNDTIQQIDKYIQLEFANVDLDDINKYYSESPGMVIDRISIMFIRKFEIQKILELIKEIELKNEYFSKLMVVDEQIKQIGNFLDKYLEKINNKECYFRIQKAVKIYNDDRVRSYIKDISNKK